MSARYYTVSNREFVETSADKALGFVLVVPDRGANVAEGTVVHPTASPAWMANYNCHVTVERDDSREISNVSIKTPFNIVVDTDGQKIKITVSSLNRIPYRYDASIGTFKIEASKSLDGIVRSVITEAERMIGAAKETYLRKNYGSLVDKALEDIPKAVRPSVVSFVSDSCCLSDADKLGVYRNFNEIFGKHFQNGKDDGTGRNRRFTATALSEMQS